MDKNQLQKITETYAWNRQDIFVAEILNRKQNGVYVELGSNHPFEGSNTYLLEKDFGWTGLSLDNEPQITSKFNEVRKNKAILADATTFDYLSYFKEKNFPKQIDYLSIDIDGNYRFDNVREKNNSLLGLISLPLTTYRFTVIHFEHDIGGNYKNGDTREAQREILTSLGYSLIVNNIEEDWWVDPNLIPWRIARSFVHFDQGKYTIIKKDRSIFEEQNV